MVVETKIDNKTFQTFHFLRESLPEVNPCIFRHISVYIAKTFEEFDAYSDIQIILGDNNFYKLVILDGTEITFINDERLQLNFTISKKSINSQLDIIVTTLEENDLSSAYAHGEVSNKELFFTVDFMADNKTGLIDSYYKGHHSTSYFDITEERDVNLDCIDGLGHLTTVMLRTNLLYDNLNNYKLVRKK